LEATGGDALTWRILLPGTSLAIILGQQSYLAIAPRNPANKEFQKDKARQQIKGGDINSDKQTVALSGVDLPRHLPLLARNLIKPDG
jgi:hypothetical protein